MSSETSKLCITCGEKLEFYQYTCPKCGTSTSPEPSDEDIYEYKHSLNRTIREGSIPLSTTFDIPGKKISEHLALITGVGNAMFTITGTTQRITNRAATKALANLFAEAKRIDADAIIGVSFTIDTHGTGFINQLVLVTGTAVKLQK